MRGKLWAAAFVSAAVAASRVAAQYPGGPVLDGAEPGEKKAIVGAGMFSSTLDGSYYLGARGGYRITDSVFAFADVGWMSSLRFEAAGEPAALPATVVQPGVLWDLPRSALRDLPLDVALRGTLFKPFLSGHETTVPILGNAVKDMTVNAEAIGGAVEALAGKDVKEKVRLYGVLGLHYLRVTSSGQYVIHTRYGNNEVPARPGGRYGPESDASAYVGVTAGGEYRFTPTVSAVVEVSYVEEPLIAAGVRGTF
jgi:hypothetical protein